MLGKKFTRLTVTDFSHKDERSRKWWKCICDCGNVTVLHTGNLNSGNTKSCGCLATETRKAKRKSVNHSEVTAVILGYKRHALRRGYEWNLTREEVEKLIVMPCHYCGTVGSNTKITKNTIEPLKYNGIDRKNNDEGYHSDNVLPCCCVCNRAKQTMNYDEFVSWIRAMAEQWTKYIDGKQI